MAVMKIRGEDGKFHEVPSIQGEPGATPNITIGTVETVPAGSDAGAEITGETPNLKMNLRIPRGNDGVTPVKGTDYFTEEEKQEIAEQAAALVPGGGGGDLNWELVGRDTVSTPVDVVRITSDTSKYKELILVSVCGSESTAGGSTVWLVSNVGALRTQASTVTAQKKAYSQIYVKACGKVFTGSSILSNSLYSQAEIKSLETNTIVKEYGENILFNGVSISRSSGQMFEEGDSFVLYGGY